jgi:hypothetical protein
MSDGVESRVIVGDNNTDFIWLWRPWVPDEQSALYRFRVKKLSQKIHRAHAQHCVILAWERWDGIWPTQAQSYTFSLAGVNLETPDGLQPVYWPKS